MFLTEYRGLRRFFDIPRGRRVSAPDGLTQLWLVYEDRYAALTGFRPSLNYQLLLIYLNIFTVGCLYDLLYLKIMFNKEMLKIFVYKVC